MERKSNRAMQEAAQRWNRRVRAMVRRNQAFYDRLAEMDNIKDKAAV